MKEHKASEVGDARSVPIMSETPNTTLAMLVCKVLVPRGTKQIYTIPQKGCNVHNVSLQPYSTKHTAQVCPHFLVHISRLQG